MALLTLGGIAATGLVKGYMSSGGTEAEQAAGWLTPNQWIMVGAGAGVGVLLLTTGVIVLRKSDGGQRRIANRKSRKMGRKGAQQSRQMGRSGELTTGPTPVQQTPVKGGAAGGGRGKDNKYTNKKDRRDTKDTRVANRQANRKEKRESRQLRKDDKKETRVENKQSRQSQSTKEKRARTNRRVEKRESRRAERKREEMRREKRRDSRRK